MAILKNSSEEENVVYEKIEQNVPIFVPAKAGTHDGHTWTNCNHSHSYCKTCYGGTCPYCD